MRITVPDQPSGRLGDAWRACVGTGRFDLALRRDYQDSLALVQRDIGFRHPGPRAAQRRGRGLPAVRVPGRAARPPLLHLRRPGDRRVPRTRHRALRGAGLHAAGTRLRRRDRLLVARQHHPAPVLERVGRPGPGHRRPPRRPVRASTRSATGRSRCGTSRISRSSGLNADQEAYHRLYEVTATAVKEVDAGSRSAARPSLRAPTSGWCAFAEYVADRVVPVDFVSKHAYTSGPAQHVPFGVHQTLGRRRTCWSSSRHPASSAGHARGRAAGAHHRVQLLVPAGQPHPRHRLPRRVPRPGGRRRGRAGGLLLLLDVQRHVRGGRASRRRCSTAASAC